MHFVLLYLQFFISTVLCENGILLTGGNALLVGHHPNVRDIEYFSPASGFSKLLNYKLKSERIDSTSATLSSEKVMVMGGQNGKGTALATTEIINLKTKKVTDGPPMTTPRTGAAAAVYKGEVWVCGGSDGMNTLRSCETFKDNKWTKAADMVYRRSQAVIAVLGDNLFSIGGFILPNTNSMAKYLYPTEFYNSKSGKWQETNKKAFLPYSSMWSGAAVLGNMIYVCGGLHRSGPNGTIEPHFGGCTKLDKTEYRGNTARLNMGRGRNALAAFDGKLYAFGGQNATESYEVTDTIEEYDLEKNEWKFVGRMTSTKADLSAVVVHI